MSTMSCINHGEKLAALTNAFRRVKEAANGIPVQFRTLELSSVINKMGEIEPTKHDAIMAHADWIVATIGGLPDEYNTNNLRDANLQFAKCVNALKKTPA